MPNHHPINTFMESCSYWKVLPQAHEESFCLLTSQWYYCLIFYPLNEMEKQRKTVQTFSHQDQKRRFHYFTFKEVLLSQVERFQVELLRKVTYNYSSRKFWSFFKACSASLTTHHRVMLWPAPEEVHVVSKKRMLCGLKKQLNQRQHFMTKEQ